MGFFKPNWVTGGSTATALGKHDYLITTIIISKGSLSFRDPIALLAIPMNVPKVRYLALCMWSAGPTWLKPLFLALDKLISLASFRRSVLSTQYLPFCRKHLGSRKMVLIFYLGYYMYSLWSCVHREGTYRLLVVILDFRITYPYLSPKESKSARYILVSWTCWHFSHSPVHPATLPN